MSNRFFTLLADGKQYLRRAIAVSSGTVDKDKIVATGSDGKLDISLMPSGLDISAESMTASEAIASGEFINIFNDGGVRKIRLADADNNRPAHGFVRGNVVIGAEAKVYTQGVNSELTELIPGNKYFLSDIPGGTTGSVTIAPGHLIQTLGTAISTTALRFEFDEPVYVD